MSNEGKMVINLSVELTDDLISKITKSVLDVLDSRLKERAGDRPKERTDEFRSPNDESLKKMVR